LDRVRVQRKHYYQAVIFNYFLGMVRLNNISIKCMLAILLATLFVSCKDEMEEYDGIRPSRLDVLGIGFDIKQEGFEKPTTRGVINDFAVNDEVAVLAMRTNNNGANWTKVFDKDTILIKKEAATKWTYKDRKKWESEYDYLFRAFYPKSIAYSNNITQESCENGGFTFTSNGSANLTLSKYRSNQNPRNNKDLLVSNAVSRPYSKDGITTVVPLKMAHLLANVNFNITNKEGTIITRHFKLRNHVTQATYNEDKWAPHYEFNNDDAENTFIIKDEYGNPLNVKFNYGQYNSGKLPEKIYVEYKEDTNNDLALKTYSSDLNSTKTINAGQTVSNFCIGLLMIPQILEVDGEEIKITLKKNNNNATITAKLSHKVEAVIQYEDEDKVLHTAIIDLTANGKVPEWKAGVKYTYNVTIYKYQATADITIEDWTHHTYEEELK